MHTTSAAIQKRVVFDVGGEKSYKRKSRMTIVVARRMAAMEDKEPNKKGDVSRT